VTTERTWADFLWYAVYFVAGYLIAADDRFTDRIKKHGRICLALWIVVFLGVGGLFALVLGFDPSAGRGFSVLYMLWQSAWRIVSWSAVVFIFSLGAKYLNLTNGLLAYSNEAVLPFFLFHQTIIPIVGRFVSPFSSEPKLLVRRAQNVSSQRGALEVFELERTTNALLVARLPKQLLRMSLPSTIDITEIPYHGQHEEGDEAVRRGRAKHGTTYFHCYATLCTVKNNKRYTLAMTE